jgi:hypothetical protein
MKPRDPVILYVFRSSQELGELKETPEMVAVVGAYVITMDQTRMAKRIFERKPDGRRKVERPGLR